MGSLKIELGTSHRDKLKRKCFESWDTNGDGFLSSPEMRVFATHVGFHGTKEEWDKEYCKLCSEEKCDPDRGVPKAMIMQLLDDPTDAGCYCTDSELEQILGMDDQSVDQNASPSSASMHTASHSSARDFVIDEELTVYFAGASYDTDEAALQKIFEGGGTIEDMSLFCLDDGRSRGMGVVRYSSAEEARYAIATIHGKSVDGYPLFVMAADASRIVGGGGASKGGYGEGRRVGSRNMVAGNRTPSWDCGPDNCGSRGGNWDYDYSTFYESQGYHGYGSQRGDYDYNAFYESQGYHGYGPQRGDGRTVFFKGVPFDTSSGYLLGKFRTVGRVQAFWLFAFRGGHSRGMGVVQYQTEQEARAAVESLSGITVDGCEMSVRMDQVGHIGEVTSEYKVAYLASSGKGRSFGKGRYGNGGGRGQATICKTCGLFFAGASLHTPEGVLRASFEEYGPVRHWSLFRMQDGRSRGMGVCTFADSETAGMAMEGGVQIDGWDLFLRADEQQFTGQLPQQQALAPYISSPWARRGKGGGSHNPRFSPYGGQAIKAAPSMDRGLGVDPRKSVFFSNAPFDAEEATIREVFEEVGRIKTCTLFRKMVNGQSCGKGVVEYFNAVAATRAYCGLHGYVLDGRQLIVDEFRQ